MAQFDLKGGKVGETLAGQIDPRHRLAKIGKYEIKPPNQHVAVIRFGKFGEQKLEAAAMAQRFDQALKIGDVFGPQHRRRPVAGVIEVERVVPRHEAA
ncbi:MAG: hypothetical protein KDA59_05560 [Planctomycetales bacterium]|nr:hypothetical protein [Planctomycetales bacterium]